MLGPALFIKARSGGYTRVLLIIAVLLSVGVFVVMVAVGAAVAVGVLRVLVAVCIRV